MPNSSVFPGQSYRLRSSFYRLTHLYYYNIYNLCRVLENAGLFVRTAQFDSDREIRILASCHDHGKTSDNFFIEAKAQEQILKKL